MRVFIGVSYDRDHETEILGVAASLQEAQRMVELHRKEMLSICPMSATNGPNGCGNLALLDKHNDAVGNVLIREVSGDSSRASPPKNDGLAKLLRSAADSPDSWDVRGLLNDAAGLLDSSADFLHRLLNPEDLGFAVTAEVRDEARALLGMKRVESAGCEVVVRRGA